MKRTKRLLSTLLALCMVLAMLPATAMAAGNTDSVTPPPANRYTVLVLDESGSMEGEPLRELKAAANRFCTTLLSANTAGTVTHNYVGMVGFSTEVNGVQEFADDATVLSRFVNNLSSNGMTNIGSALKTAKDMLDKVQATDAAAIKNIVLLSDGLPEIYEIGNSDSLAAQYAAKGPYYKSVYGLNDYFIGSANYSEETIVNSGLRNTFYNIYTLGFFHTLKRYPERVVLCTKILNDIKNMSFHEVMSSDNLSFVLGEVVAGEILGDGTGTIVEVDPDGKFGYTDKGCYVIGVACPVDVSVSYRGEVFLDSVANKVDANLGHMEITPTADGTSSKTIYLDTSVGRMTNYEIKITAQDSANNSPVVITADYYPNGTNDTSNKKPVLGATTVSISKGQTSAIYPMGTSNSDQLVTAPGLHVTDPTSGVNIGTKDPLTRETDSHFTFVPTVTGGTVVLSKRNAEAGDWVNVYVTPDEGYKLESLTVTDMRGWPVTLREMGENAFSFTMPNARINVNPVFVKVEADDGPYSTNVPATIPNIEGTSPNYGNMVINTAAMNYSDVNAGDWFYNNVKFCHERYLLNKTGEAEGKFEPNTASTRATVWTALSRLAGRNTVTQGDNWYDRAQIWAKGKGITDGERPMDSMTREEFVTMLWRYDGNKYVQNSALGQFNDGESVSWWATEAVKWAVATGLLNGSNGSLNPQSNVTRAEVAAVLQRYVQNVH